MPVPRLSKQAEFAEHLFQEGYPLWSPDPSGLPPDRERDGIKIGDVGVVKADGHFFLLFNICEAHSIHQSEPRTGSPLIHESEISALDYYQQVAPRSIIASPPTSWTIDPHHDSNTSDQLCRTTVYRTELSANGSHIILPHGADFHEATPNVQLRFEALVRQHWREWDRIARERVNPGDFPLYLVTGFHKTTSWAVASFRISEDAPSPVGARCHVVVDESRQVLLPDTLWNPTGRFPHNFGPPPENEGRRNQSVFISGIRITSRPPVPQPKPRSVWVKASSSFLKMFRKGQNSKKDTAESAETTSEDVEVPFDRVPRIQQASFFRGRCSTVSKSFQRASHPGDIINQYLLTKEPSAGVAVTHDARWVTLVKKGQISTIEDLEGHVEQLVSEHYSIHVERGIVYLGDKESTKEESPQMIRVEETPFAGGELADIYLGTLRTSVKTIKVAVKVFRSHLANVNGFDEIVNQARLVIELWSTLDHTNVLSLIGTCMHHSSPFPAMVTPWAEHGNLSSYLNRSNRKLTDADMIVLIHDVASGLQYLHSKNIVHGSLTTSNILVDTGGRASVDFFSLSAIVSAASPASVLHSSIRGRETLLWVAPELLQGKQKGVTVEDPANAVPTKETDMYALGGIMLQILVPNYFQDTKAALTAFSGVTPERPHGPHLTDPRWSIAHQCFTPPTMRPSAKEIVEFAKHELPQSLPPAGDLTDYKTLVADMDSSDVASRNTATSRTLVEMDITNLSLGGSSKALVSGAFDAFDRSLIDLTGVIKLTNDGPLAGGGFADVYEGLLYNGVGTKVAIKVPKLYKNIGIHKTAMQVRYEIMVWSRLKHDNVLPLLGTSVIFGKLPEMVSPWAENGILTTYLNSKALTEVQILSLVHNVASGLHYLHSKNIVHGSLSGPNILVDKSGKALLSDFGLSVILEESEEPTSHMRGRGTLRWVAPEVLTSRPTEHEDARHSLAAIPRKESDIYSFGSLMLQILSGKVPYHNYNEDVRLKAAVLRGITPSRPNDPPISDRRWSLIQSCWSSVDLRPPSKEIVQFTEQELSRCPLPQIERTEEQSSTRVDMTPTTGKSITSQMKQLPTAQPSTDSPTTSRAIPPLPEGTTSHPRSSKNDEIPLYSLPAPPDLTGHLIKIDARDFGGAFCDVYRCVYNSPSGTIEVAVKVFRSFISFNGDDTKVSKMIRRELGIWRRLAHPNIVPFLGIATGFGMEGSTSLVSLWMPNGTLDDFLEYPGKKLSVGHQLQLLTDVAHGIDYLHKSQIIHGNLNSNNVLLDTDFNARLIDFGHSSFIGNIPGGLTYLGASAARPGAVQWVAPEQLEEEYERTTKTDIYTFGSIALQVLSGKKPWSEVSKDAVVILRLAKGQKPKRPSSRPIEDQHWAFIQRCWSPVEDRPSSQEVVSTIQEFLRSVPPFPPLREVFTSRPPWSDSVVDLSTSHTLTDKLKGKQRLVDSESPPWETPA